MLFLDIIFMKKLLFGSPWWPQGSVYSRDVKLIGVRSKDVNTVLVWAKTEHF